MDLGVIVDGQGLEIDITPMPQILQLLENLSVEPWRCVAELIDNSLDDFRRTKNPAGIVKVYYDDSGVLVVEDNGSGMSPADLESALKAGHSSKAKSGELGLFGVGFNVACARLGRRATIQTKQVNASHWTQAVVDVNDLIRRKSFAIKTAMVDRDGGGASGTRVIIELQKEHRANFSRARFMQGIADELGQAYSFILRAGVPGLTGEVAGAPRPVTIMVGDQSVKPRLPCIWSEDRSVLYKGQEVKAVQKFSRDLPDALVCQGCGHWITQVTLSECSECGSNNLSLSSRRVWGWIGVQRYMDRLNFGLNFIRNGRTILSRDQEIFTFFDPNTGEAFKDYPVEWPADMGRIVGEIHCDHVPVDFIKREFDKDDRGWLGVVEVVRGNTSLQPKRATSVNESPLAKIFNAFRINEPGKRYLIPGNGAKAIHEASKNWAAKFHEGDPDFLTDEKWFKAADSHDRKDAVGGGEAVSPASNPSPSPVLSPVASAPGSVVAVVQPGIPAAKIETQKQKMERWEKGGVERADLSKSVTLPSVGKTYNLVAWETFSELTAESGKSVAAIAIPVSGNNLRLYAYRKASIFERFGRDTADVLLMEAAQQIKVLSSSSESITTIFSELLNQFPDEERSEAVIRSRIGEIETRLQAQASGIISKKPLDFWSHLSADVQSAAEENAAASGKNIEWLSAVANGRFSEFLPLEGFSQLIEYAPEMFFDGALFNQHYASAHAEAARQRTKGYVLRALSDLTTVGALQVKMSKYELETAEVALDFVNSSLLND